MCSKGLFMFMIVASVTALIFGASKEKFSKITELARDDTCIKLNEECAPPEKSCCKDFSGGAHGNERLPLPLSTYRICYVNVFKLVKCSK
uniref:U23-Saltitoxin-Pre1c_1 n=1 Tax=Phidippus regius TaxID=1905328 RepID=A0A482Z6H1_9ARAC